MSRDFYAEGYETGQASASVYEWDIKSAHRDSLAAICGRKIAEIRERSDQWHVQRAQSWVLGFFDGWMDRADRILSGDQN